MPAYCEVALPVPLDRTFTYAVRQGQNPQRGSRVIAPFRSEKLIGIVLRLSAKAPADFEVKYLEAVIDQDQGPDANDGPLLSEALLTLAEWMAQYYLAPLGEVLRGMLPLMAEVRRIVYYRITDLGRDVLARTVENDSQAYPVSEANDAADNRAFINGTGMIPQIDPAAEKGPAFIPNTDIAFEKGPGISPKDVNLDFSKETGLSPDANRDFVKDVNLDFLKDVNLDFLKGTGFSPYINQPELEGALAPEGPTKRGGKVPQDQRDQQHRVLARLASGDLVKVSTLRTATSATQPLLAAMLRKKWIARETAAVERDARRTERFAVLIADTRLPSLTQNQQAILAELAACGGELPLAQLRSKDLPSPTLQTLVRRGLVRIDERPAVFRLGGIESTAQPFQLNEPQTEALASLVSSLGAFKPFLLHGITGSGKTAVYLAAMQCALDRGLASILLVPEIGLTPQIAGLLDAAFGAKVALLHSALTLDERSEQWRRIHRGEAPIIVGTRSAIFAPVPNLGLILVDEEHDQSYKQEETPRYNARDVAVMRAKFAGAVVVLGSATPSLESWQNSAQKKYTRLEMRDRVMHRPLPQVELIDMRTEFQQTGKEQLFSRSLIAETRAALDRGEQALILLNRRGYSFAILCRACGEKLECQNCAIALTHHKPPAEQADIAREGQRLECHLCGYRRTVPARCPKCDSEHMYYLGAGSEQGEERLAEIFPSARIGRMDRDTVRGRYDLERLLARLHSGEIDLLVGTQMIAKGHDIHGITLVGVVGCDHALSMPDFRAAERVFQLMTQVSGRAGRGELPGRVVVQTYYPDHYAILAASTHDYASFVEKELKYRRWMHYPPFGVLANVLVQSARLPEAAEWASILGKWFQKAAPEGVRVLGPCTAPVARIKGIYRFHLILKAASRKALNDALRDMLMHADEAGVPRRNLIVDVDAQRLM